MLAANGPALVYLDHAATTPLLDAAADAMREASMRYPANPASQHGPGREARRTLEQARSRVGELLGADINGREADRVVFTSGGTEANNLALGGLAGGSGTLVVSAAEHPSVAVAAEVQAERGRRVKTLPLDHNGVAATDRLEGLLAEGDVSLVSVQLGSNETGVLQPIDQLVAVCAHHGAALHTDAVQAVGKIDVNFRRLGATALTCTAHKFHGPPGIGVLLVRSGTPIDPLLAGGHQQEGARPGTETVALAVGMRVALEAWYDERTARRERMIQLRTRLEEALLAEFPHASAIGKETDRLPHISNLAFRGLDRQAFTMALDLAGVACSTGSACASGSSEPSPTLLAMGLDEEAISGSLRLSLGATTTATEIDLAIRRILSVGKQLRTSTSG